MPRPRKTIDPRLVALREREVKEQERFTRWYGRLRRAITAMEKSRRAIVRIQKRIRDLTTQENHHAEHP